MKILLPKYAGFCFGVRRATQEAMKAAKHSPPPVFSLGPIIHNPQEVERLEKEGVNVANSLKEIPTGGTVIIRSHGLAPEVVEDAQRRGLNIVNATCPLVKKSQEYAELLYREGYLVIVIGNPQHPEIKSVTGYTDYQALVVESEGQVKELPKAQKIGVVLQTTQQLELCQHIISLLIPKADELRVFNTLCDATFQRQKEALEMARKAEVMIVVGGRNSANTTHLAEICKKAGSVTHHIETAAELDKDWFSRCQVVGVTAGASTPSWVISEVVERLNEIAKSNNRHKS
jgi:(E)-4-hydroxy-3-methyl-but-2-enyl pyrophosphate reductase